MTPIERLAAALLAVFVLACTAAGFTIHVAVGLYSLALSAFVVAIVVGWESE